MCTVFCFRIAYADFVHRFGLLLRVEDPKTPFVDISNTSGRNILTPHVDTPRPMKKPRYDTPVGKSNKTNMENTPPGRKMPRKNGSRPQLGLGSRGDFTAKRHIEDQFSDTYSFENSSTAMKDKISNLTPSSVVSTPVAREAKVAKYDEGFDEIDADFLTPNRGHVSERKRRRRAGRCRSI